MAKVKLGPVVYTDGNGFEKLAFVIGTRKTTQKGTDVTRPEKGHANLLVFSPKDPQAKNYVRWNVAQGDGPRKFRQIGALVQDDELVNV